MELLKDLAIIWAVVFVFTIIFSGIYYLIESGDFHEVLIVAIIGIPFWVFALLYRVSQRVLDNLAKRKIKKEVAPEISERGLLPWMYKPYDVYYRKEYRTIRGKLKILFNKPNLDKLKEDKDGRKD